VKILQKVLGGLLFFDSHCIYIEKHCKIHINFAKFSLKYSPQETEDLHL